MYITVRSKTYILTRVNSLMRGLSEFLKKYHVGWLSDG